jgi:hypothetical protein
MRWLKFNTVGVGSADHRFCGPRLFGRVVEGSNSGARNQTAFRHVGWKRRGPQTRRSALPAFVPALSGSASNCSVLTRDLVAMLVAPRRHYDPEFR